MESIIDYLKRHLKAAGPAQWERIAACTGVARSLPRKLVYDATRENPRVRTIQPLLDFFKAIDYAESPNPKAKTKKAV